MDVRYPEWTYEFKERILPLIQFSLKASVAMYDQNWWKQNNGIPTGGSLCVQLANITVYYVMSKNVYSLPEMMVNVAEVKRYIDDGGGFYAGLDEEFHRWLMEVNRRIGEYGLYIDESNIKSNSEFINLLDI